MNERKIDPIRPTDAAARELAHTLLRDARHGALAVIEPGTGMPLASRIAIGADADRQPVFLASDLSFHSRALAVDPRASILVGEPGRGDPLAHPRITLIGRAVRLPGDADEHEWLRRTWLGLHPKSALYIDFADFHFFRLVLERAHLNGGFGRAYVLDAADLAASR